jgi:hypothetical protein
VTAPTAISSREREVPDKTLAQMRAEADEERFIKALVQKHGGGFHGPRVEHLSMEEQAFYRMMREFRHVARQRYDRRLSVFTETDRYMSEAELDHACSSRAQTEK